LTWWLYPRVPGDGCRYEPKHLEETSMHNATLIFIICVIVVAGCNRGSPSKMILGEGQSTAEGLSLTNGNVILKEGQPGLAFAFATKPSQSKEFTYILVFNHDFPNGGIGTQSNSGGLTASTSHAITAFGADCKVEYRVGLNAVRKAVETEAILIADAPFDPTKGKLFLVDMKASPPTVTQLNLELPSHIPDLKETDAMERFAQDTLEGLRKTDKTVDEFCRRIETKGS
jgi:hypothetical protein